ncbi:MAG: VacJ family lipoprotein [Rickettsiales bacterium]|nr:VacJ family lipoprotein [Rickettsiales bacterium]
MKKRQQNRYLFNLSLLFFCLFFANNSVFIKTSEAAQQKEVLNDDFYDLDYEPSNGKSGSDVWDPWEKVNRKTFAFNMFFLDYVVHPFYYDFYVKVTTSDVRKSVHNVVSNWGMPMTFANYVLQLDFKNSARSLYSFIMNTTFGVLGIFDVAGIQDVRPDNTNFSITLAKYKVPAGPYIVLPFLGGNDIRGTVAGGGEFMINPIGFNVFKIGGEKEVFEDWVYWAEGTLFVLDNSTYVMENFYDLIKSSFDPYVMMRDAFGQSQVYKIKKVKGEK